MIRAALLIALASPASAETSTAIQSLVDYHTAACTAQGGSLTVPSEAFVEVHFFGPEEAALMLDSSKLTCSTAPAMFCAGGVGCEINVFVGDAQHSLIVLDWSVVPDDDRELLEVTIAGELINKPEPGTFRMTWDSAASSLMTVD